METPEKILADLLGTTEEYISKNAQSNPPYEGEYFVYIEAMKKYADTKVKNLAQPDVSRQLPSVYDLDIQMLRNTATDAEFRRKIQQWLEGNFG